MKIAMILGIFTLQRKDWFLCCFVLVLVLVFKMDAYRMSNPPNEHCAWIHTRQVKWMAEFGYESRIWISFHLVVYVEEGSRPMRIHLCYHAGYRGQHRWTRCSPCLFPIGTLRLYYRNVSMSQYNMSHEYADQQKCCCI